MDASRGGGGQKRVGYHLSEVRYSDTNIETLDTISDTHTPNSPGTPLATPPVLEVVLVRGYVGHEATALHEHTDGRP